MKKLTHCIALGIFCLLLAACEKTEFIETTDGLTHCPVNWLSRSWRGGPGIGPANPQDSNILKSKISVETGALYIRRYLSGANFMLFYQGRPESNGGHSMRSLEGDYTVELKFQPETVDEGVQLKFFIDSLTISGAYRTYFGFDYAPYAVFIQKEAQGYVVGYEYNEATHFWPDTLPNFESGSFVVKKSGIQVTLEVVLVYNNGNIELKRYAQTLPYFQNQPYTFGLKMALLPAYAGNDALSYRSFWAFPGFFYTGQGQVRTDEFNCNSVAD